MAITVSSIPSLKINFTDFFSKFPSNKYWLDIENKKGKSVGDPKKAQVAWIDYRKQSVPTLLVLRSSMVSSLTNLTIPAQTQIVDSFDKIVAPYLTTQLDDAGFKLLQIWYKDNISGLT